MRTESQVEAVTIGNIIFSLAGMAVFAGFFVIDFARLKIDPDNSRANAVFVAMKIYLDFINFLLFLLRFLASIVGIKTND